MRLMKADFKKTHQRGIQGIDPENRLIRVIHVFMPGPIRIGKKVTFLHGKGLTFNHTASSLALDDETHACLGVAMSDGVFAGLKHLNIELKSVRCCAFGGTAQTDDPSRNPFQPNDLTSLNNRVLDIFPLPKAGLET